MNIYGSLTNRLEEGKTFTNEIKVGTGVTRYYWSDREPYEVVKVIDQKHCFIREMDAERIDHNGMSEDQEYKYTSNESNPIIEVKKFKKGWKQIFRFNQDCLKTGVNFKDCDKIYQQLANGKKEVVRSEKISISFGYAEKYYDYSF